MDEPDIIFAFGPFRLSPRRRQLTEGGSPVPLGARAFAILHHLVAHAGRTVDKAELTSAVWGGRAVEDNNLTVQMSAVRRALGEGRGEPRFLLTVPGSGYRFIAPVGRLDDGGPPTVVATNGNLPHPATPFVGRMAELAALGQILGEARLVTVTGVGGIGKTRLALQAAAAAGERPDGTWIVDLAAATGPLAVAETIGAVLGLGGNGGPDIEAQLLGHLKPRRLLLMLDNCEHMAGTIAHLATAILRHCPGVALLATSRERLGVAGERLFRLPPLPFPAEDAGIEPAQALAYDAVRLFVDRATATIEGFTVDAGTIGTIARICARLDGIALAIEMAVPRLRVLTPDQIEQRLAERFRLLVTQDRDALPRQRTLRSMIDWSYELLGDSERHVLQTLSVFAGGATLAAVTAVIDGDELTVIDSLAALVEKSLVVADRRGAGMRFRLLETVRYYAAEKLDLAGRQQACRQRHATYYARLFATAEADWATTPTGRWLDHAGPEVDNLRTALDWAFGPDGDRDLGLALTAASYPLWWDLPQMPLREGRRRLERAQANLSPDTPAPVAGRLWLALSWRDMRNNDTANIPAAELSVDIFRRSGDRLRLGAALWRLITTRFQAASPGELRRMLDEAEAALRPLGASKWLALVLIKRADVALFAGRLDTALAGYTEAMGMADAVDYWYAQIVCTTNLSELLFDLGRGGEAILRLVAMRDRLPASRHAPLLAPLAGHLLLAGRDDEMRAAARATIDGARMVGFTAAQGWVAEALALHLAERGAIAEAACLAGHARAVHPLAAARIGARRVIFQRLEQALCSHNCASSMAEGGVWTVEQAADAILQHCQTMPQETL